MKFLSLFALLFTTLNAAHSQLRSDTIKVYGNCEACQERIEKSLKIKGVQTASWNPKTKLLFVSYDEKEKSESWKYGGKTVLGDARPKDQQLKLF